MTLKEFYEQLLILQYYNQPRARAEIGIEASRWQALKEFLDRFKREFDLDFATGDRLDKIGKLVGVSRFVPFVVEKEFFGFDINPESVGFASKFDPSRRGAPFKDKFGINYTATQLDDADYLFLIRAKIAFNQVHAKMSGDEVTLNDVIAFLFDGGYVIDNKNMTLTLFLPFSVDLRQLRIVLNSGLIPTPQAVGYSLIYQGEVGGTFGFDNNPNSLGFGNKFDSSYNGGKFARKVLL
jgi:hypothetical protein